MEGFVVVLIAAILAVFKPHPKTSVILVENEKEHNAIVVSTDKGSVLIDKPYMKVELVKKDEPPTSPVFVSKKEIDKKFGKVLNLLPTKPVTFYLYFKPNSTELTEESKKELKKILSTVKNRMPCSVDIIGHTDTVGSWKKNAELSLKRANFVKGILIKEGMDSSLLSAKGYGESDLIVKTADEVSKAENRAVEIFIR